MTIVILLIWSYNLDAAYVCHSYSLSPVYCDKAVMFIREAILESKICARKLNNLCIIVCLGFYTPINP